MNMRLSVLLFSFLLIGSAGLYAQKSEVTSGTKRQSWVKFASKLESSFFHTVEAQRIANNVLLYQQETGGWPKNVYIPAELSDSEQADVLAARENVNESTIDNGATTTEIRYLSRVYEATGIAQYKEGALNGIRYILHAQYPNGGWPQFWPRPKGYYTHITYNDNAMVNVMRVLREIYEKQPPYTYVPDSLCMQARLAFDKGVECILKTQIYQDGKLTLWCAQHDEKSLAPAKARAYELPSICGQESLGIIKLLLSLPEPSQEVITAVESAIAWLKENKITGLKREAFTDTLGREDYRMVPCQQQDGDCQVLWARFYELETSRPFFCDRDGVKRYNISEIGYERRNGYKWYNTDAIKVLAEYEQWKEWIKR